ncbi:MAG: efflux RND transporter periplasmic adaptor subunit [Desulfobacteraceae bacterium]|nr:efflux RND transporter periplasmic adaptor subunit [Desulfobacteraceae bacterium]MBC2752410.1 efflux RND transporter periplasmic adaptor subunit [Desulfobacteraceae bacterium]
MRPKTLTLLLCLLLTVSACQNKEEAAQAPPPPDIPVVVLQAQDVPLFMEFVGQVHGLKDIAMRARVEGFLEGIHFEEGSQVEEGKLLYTLESQPFEEAVANRMSQVAEAQTMLAKASSDLGRIKPLAELKAVSQSDLDGAVAQFEAAQAALDAAQANLRAARIQLGYTKVYSPINGIIGKTKAKVGDFVGREPNPVILNVVSQIDTVLVEFFLTENQYLEAARRFLAKAQGVESEKEKAVLELILSDGSLYSHKGKVDFIDRDVDPTTGAILLQASFPNPEGLLRPGQFAKVKVRSETVRDGILVPQRCVTELQGLYSVFVVGQDNTVKEHQITLGPAVGSAYLVKEGLTAGDQVVYEGLQMVRDGAVVNPVVKDISANPPEEK